MRKLTGAVFQSLDGVMQAPGGPEEDPTGGFRFGGWSFHFWDESLEKPFGKVIEADTTCCSASGPTTFSPAYWPYNQDDPIGAKFQRINKYVLTHSDEPLAWEHSHKLSGDTAEAVAELKRSDGRDLLIQGSSTLYAPLLAAGLIDRLVRDDLPGRARRAARRSSTDRRRPGALKLVEHFVSDKGVAFLAYEPAGEVPTGIVREKSQAKGSSSGARNGREDA